MYDSGVAFINCHLSSGENEGDELKRNYDYSEIVRRGLFPEDTPGLEPEVVLPSGAWHLGRRRAAAHGDMQCSGGLHAGEGGISKAVAGRGPGQWGEQRRLLDCDHIVWLGDLNYRLDLPDDQVLKQVATASAGRGTPVLTAELNATGPGAYQEGGI